MVLCPIPTFAHLFKTASADDCRARLAEAAEETGVELIDLLPTLWELLGEWRARGASICPLDDADYRRRGLSSLQTTDRRIIARLRRRLSRDLQRRSLLEQRDLGPLWPHLS